MALKVDSVRLELRTLLRRRDDIDRRIKGLQIFLGEHKLKERTTSVNTKRGTDIRPFVRSIFSKNDNESVRYQVLQTMIEREFPELDRRVIATKLEYIKRSALSRSGGYGMYRWGSNPSAD